MNQEKREFQQEHLRLMQALLESIEKQCSMHQQLRGLKESLVSTAVRLHVSARVAEEDGSSMAQLRQEALQAKRRTLEAEKKANNASDLIMNLNNEMLNLKKALREAGIDSQRTTTIGGKEGITQNDADNEVDDMMERFAHANDNYHDDGAAATTIRPMFLQLSGRGASNSNNVTQPSSSSWQPQNMNAGQDNGVPRTNSTKNNNNNNNNTEQRYSIPFIDHFPAAAAGGGFPSPTKLRPNTADGRQGGLSSSGSGGGFGMSMGSRPSTSAGGATTPFKQWKTDRLVWSPDTAAGSEYYDKDAAEISAQLEELEVFQDGVTRVTKSRAGHIKARVFDTTAIAAGIAAATRKITRLPSVDLAMAVASREAISESKEGYQYQTGVDKDTSKEYLGPIGPDGKRMSKYHYDKARFAVKEAGKGDIEKEENSRVSSKLFRQNKGTRGLAK